MLSMLLFSGCADTNSVDDTVSSDAERIYDDSTIVWTLPYMAEPCDFHVEELNEKLREDGYSYQIAFNQIEMGVNVADYHEEVMDILEKGETDIAFLGYAYAGYLKKTVVDVMRDGNVYDLTEYLQSEAGHTLYDSYPEEIWNASGVDEKQYFLPSENLTYGMSYLVFNGAYFDEAVLEDFEGSLESMLSLVESYVPDTVSYPLLWVADSRAVASMTGYADGSYFFTSLETGKAENPLQISEIQEFVRQSDAAEKEGILCGVEDDTTLLEIEEERDFGIIVGATGDYVNESAEDLILVRMSFSLFTQYGSGTGVASKSKHKEDALEFLTLLRTDPEYANLLIWGEEGEDYQLIDGYADSVDETQTGRMNRSVTGVFDMAASTREDYFAVDSRESKGAFLASENYQHNVLIGFIPEYQDKEIDYGGLHDLLSFCLSPTEREYSDSTGVYINKDYYETTEGWLSAANGYYVQLGGNHVIDEVNQQITGYLEQRNGE